jgi:hypothetical protein
MSDDYNKMFDIFCKWWTNSGAKCRSNRVNGEHFCPIHMRDIIDYELNTDNTPCDTYEEKYIETRSYEHLKSQLESANFSGYVETKSKYGEGQADWSDTSYIEMLCDEKRFYYDKVYAKKNGVDHVSLLKIKIPMFCPEKSVVRYLDRNYCEKCYAKKNMSSKLKTIILKRIHNA